MKIGKTILHYNILEKLGQGGMGVVYKAEDTKLDRTVAIKFLPKHIADNSEERERFVIEAKAAAALNHPNIATIHAIEESDDDMFIVMEYIEGQELKHAVRAPGDVPLPVEDIINFATQIASGLQAAHEKGIIHRDIKSSNIMITPKGQVKIMDFGLAKVRGVASVTKEGTTLGTITYMSPEQTRGEVINQRSDIWSFGVVFYEMLTGQLPFKGDYEQAIIYSILNEEPEAMTDVASEIEQIVLKALAKNPDERYQSADELAADLQVIGSGQSVKVRSAAKSKLTYWIATVAVVLIAVAFFLFRSASQPIPEKENIKTIAVLPFLDLSPDKDQEYFSDGISEELLNVLARNPKLRVTSRTSAFSFKGKEVDIKTIAAKLNVQHILEGSVRKAGNSLRITAQLIDVETDAHLWSQTYDGTLDNIFALQDSISGSVAEALKIALLEKKSATQQRETDPEAYNAYLLGKHFSDLRGKENWEKAEGYYEKALSIDSNYALAWVGLSEVHRSQAGQAYIPVDEGYHNARQEAEKARELNPNLAAAHAEMGSVKRGYDWDWSGADASYQRALALEPGNAGVISGAALLASTLGRFDEAIALDRRAIELDPVRTYLYSNLGWYAWYAGLLDESIAAFKKCLELNPQYLAVHKNIGLVYLEKGQPDSALAEIQKEIDSFWKQFGLAIAYHALGKKKEADEKLAELIKSDANDGAFQIAEIYAYRNEKDKAFEWLERAYDQRDGGLSYMKGDPVLRNIEKDPRYAAFLKKMKLPL